MASTSGKQRGWRRKLLTIGGIGVMVGVGLPARPAHAVHDPDEIGIGLDNPTGGNPEPTNRTRLRTAIDNASEAGFEVVQSTNAVGVAMRATGALKDNGQNGGTALDANGGAASGGAPDTGNGGTAVDASGGSISGDPGASERRGGVGVRAVGGNAGSTGIGGAGVLADGGRSMSAPGMGVIGVGGQNESGNAAIGGVGVQGFGGFGALPPTRTGVGVYGESTSGFGVAGFSASAPGVIGLATTGNGVRGVSESGVGIRGDAIGASQTAIEGVAAGSGYGVFGRSQTGVGVRGIAFGPSAAGVEGVASGAGPGVWGFTNSGHAVLGNSQSGNGGVFSSTNGWGVSVNTTTGAVGVFSRGNPFAFQGQGSLVCTGTGHFGGGIVVLSRVADGTLRGVAATVAAEHLVEDIGRARLVDGVARVDLDPIFSQIADTSDYDVFPVPNGDCNGLYVTSRTPTTFVIRELRGGTSSLDVSYRVVAKRAGARGAGRFARVEEPPKAPEFPAMPALPERPREDPLPDRLPKRSASPTAGPGPVAPPAPRR